MSQTVTLLLAALVVVGATSALILLAYCDELRLAWAWVIPSSLRFDLENPGV